MSWRNTPFLKNITGTLVTSHVRERRYARHCLSPPCQLLVYRLVGRPAIGPYLTTTPGITERAIEIFKNNVGARILVSPRRLGRTRHSTMLGFSLPVYVLLGVELTLAGLLCLPLPLSRPAVFIVRLSKHQVSLWYISSAYPHTHVLASGLQERMPP